jgi:hypothetical protein
MDRNVEADCRKLADAFFKNLRFCDSCEYGCLGTDCKRPFGNSYVEGDILEIIGWEPEGDDGDGACLASWQKEYANDLFQNQLIPFLQKEWKRLTQPITSAAQH